MEEFPRLLECKEMAGKVAQIAAGKGYNTATYQHILPLHSVNTSYTLSPASFITRTLPLLLSCYCNALLQAHQQHYQPRVNCIYGGAT